MLIGITGTIGAGKDTAINYIVEKYGFIPRLTSDILKEEARKRGLEPNRDNLHNISNEIRDNLGSTYLINRLIEGLDFEKQNVLISSIRHSLGADHFRKIAPSGKIIAFDAPIDIRYARISKRGTEKDNVDFDTFKMQEEREMHSDNPNRQNISACMAKADFHIINDSTPEDFYKKIDEVMANLSPHVS